MNDANTHEAVLMEELRALNDFIEEKAEESQQMRTVGAIDDLRSINAHMNTMFDRVNAIESELNARHVSATQQSAPARTSSQLLESMDERFRKYNEGGRSDRSLVLSADAIKDASALWSQTSTPDGNVPMIVRQTLAWFHWARYYALPQDEDVNDLQAAIVLFAPVFLAAPGEVPQEVRDFLETNSPAAIVDNGRNRGDKPESYVYRTYPNALDYALTLSRM
jgi:hypothetical protein